MNTKIFINLPVTDLPRSLAFFKALGYADNPQFTDTTVALIVISDEIHVMAMTHAKFKELMPKSISAATKSAVSLSCESRQQVDDLVAKAVTAGGSIYEDPQDYGFMYRHGFADPDGHLWGLIHMRAMPPQN